MKVPVTVSLIMMNVCMIIVIVAVPAVIVTPMPATYNIASMLLAMLLLVFACMTNSVAVSIVAPIILSITIVVLDGCPLDFECKTWVSMFSSSR